MWWNGTQTSSVIVIYTYKTQYCAGYLESEIQKDRIVMLDSGGSEEAPLPREMTDLEVFEAMEHFINALLGYIWKVGDWTCRGKQKREDIDEKILWIDWI